VEKTQFITNHNTGCSSEKDNNRNI